MNRQAYFQRVLQAESVYQVERYEDRILQLDESIWGVFTDKVKSAASTVKKKVNTWLKGKNPKKKKKAEQMRAKIEKLETEYRKRKEKAIAKVKARAERQGISLKQAEEDVPWIEDLENWIGSKVQSFEREILGVDVESEPSKLMPGDYAAAGRAGGASGRTSGGTGTATKTRGYLENVNEDVLTVDLNSLTESLSILERVSVDEVLVWWEEAKYRLPRNIVLDIQQKINAVTGHWGRAGDSDMELDMYTEEIKAVLRRAREELEIKLAVIAHNTKSEKSHRTLLHNMQKRAQAKGRHYSLVDLERIWRQEIDNADIRLGLKNVEVGKDYGDWSGVMPRWAWRRTLPQASREGRDKWFFARVMKSFKRKIGISESVINESWDLFSWLRQHWTLVKTTVEMYRQNPGMAKTHVRELEKQFGGQVRESLHEATDDPPSLLMKAAQWLWGLHPSTHLLWLTAVALLHIGVGHTNLLGGGLLTGVWLGLLGWVLKLRGVVESCLGVGDRLDESLTSHPGLTESAAYVRKLALKTGISVEHAEARWAKAKAQAAKQGRHEDWAYITGIFKKMMGESRTLENARRRKKDG